MSKFLFRIFVSSMFAFLLLPISVKAQKAKPKTKAKKPVIQAVEMPVKSIQPPAPNIVSSELEKAVLDEINAARSDPQTFISYLEEYKKTAAGKSIILPNKTKVIMIEDAELVLSEAISDLEKMSKTTSLSFSDGLLEVAKNHYGDLKDNFSIGHNGKDGSGLEKRMLRVGEVGKDVAENLSFGAESARAVVLAWIIDDGNKSRPHRKSIFNSKFKLFGVACGKSIKNESFCVAEFANTFRVSKLPAGVIQIQ